MIEWKPIDQWAYYANDRHTEIGELWIDRSRSPKMWRLRHFIRNGNGCTILRIQKAANLSMLRGWDYSKMRVLMANGIVHVAKTIGLKPRGEPYQLSNNMPKITNLAGRPWVLND